jgi:hypothetical protein
LSENKIDQIEPMVEIPYQYDWEKLMTVIRKDFD